MVEARPKPRAPRAETVLMGRFGNFFLTGNGEFERPHANTLSRIAESLEEDPRVSRVEEPEGIEDAWCAEPTIFPAPADDADVVSGTDARFALTFSQGLAFSVTVPEKNQPKKRDGDTVPTEYSAIWDGVLMLVTWRIPAARGLPLSGGHVVSEVLGDALNRLGLMLYAQGCNASCHHEFAHTDIRFLQGDRRPRELEYVECGQRLEVHAHVPERSDQELTRLVFNDLRGVALRFGQLKNYGRRILEAESDGRDTLEALLDINYARAGIPMLSFRDRVEARWSARGWLRETRLLIARVWLGLAHIESLRREWFRYRLEFEKGASLHGRGLLFQRDYADEVDRVESLNPELMRSGIQEIAERLDSRALLRVTAIAAVAGAIAGGIVGAIAGGL